MDCDGFEYLLCVHRADQELRFGRNARRLRVVLRRLEKLCADHKLIPLLKDRIAELEAGVQVAEARTAPAIEWPVAWSVNPPRYAQH